ncbi:13189_t:CDS:2 [Ambispora leptoticha]|uniref:13189_t:CDS:1 n=1 Tax=Ambispora leptoticha TaxID=144679 RepID=A0A9N9AVE2_9GLOM|nr:13189_t:CDS:2 [Ambispora leptoticha]
MADIVVSIIERAISIGQEIAARIADYKDAVESLKKLEILLGVLKNVVEEIYAKADKSIIIMIQTTAQDTEKVYMNCVKELDIRDKKQRDKFAKLKKVVSVYKAPKILSDIESAIQKVQLNLNITESSLSIVRHVQALANTIDELVARLKKEIQELQKKLENCTLSVESSFIEGLGSDNPEAISVWKDRFRSAELSISSIAPYECVFVSWARFVHELEVNFPLKNIPTAIKEDYFGDIDAIRKHGNRYYINPNGTRNLKDIRPLWLPALCEALDPLHRGYVNPYNYLSFLDGKSLSNKLRQIVLDSCGYGIFVECRRTRQDIALPSEIESPAHSVGWMSFCQIISVPSPEELGIFIYDEGTKPQLKKLIENYTYPKNDIWVYVRYLQTGQIERKLLSEDVRMLGGLRIGISIAICYTLENGSCWSDSLSIVGLKACAGGRYIVTAGSKENTIEFVTKPPIGFDDHAVRSDQLDNDLTILEFDYCLLGPSTFFTEAPKKDEKIQIKADGYWYDVKVTAVNGENVEYVDWSSTSDTESPTNDETFSEENDEDEDGPIGFSDDQLATQEKTNSRNWCPWKRGVTNLEIRPYRCLHIGDLVEAPVVYPDYLFRYYGLEESQLYLPARIIDVQGDQYRVKFNPTVVAYAWWPNDNEYPRGPNSKETVKNPIVDTEVMVSMDRVRPYVAGGSHPVLGPQSIIPQSWSVFQGAQFRDVQQVEEKILWKQ